MTRARRFHLLTFCAVAWVAFAGVAMSAPPALPARILAVSLASVAALVAGMVLETRTTPDALRRDPR